MLEIEERVHMSAQLYSKPNRYLKMCARKSTSTLRECTFFQIKIRYEIMKSNRESCISTNAEFILTKMSTLKKLKVVLLFINLTHSFLFDTKIPKSIHLFSSKSSTKPSNARSKIVKRCAFIEDLRCYLAGPSRRKV